MCKRLDNDSIFKIINLYRSHPELWDKNGDLYRRRDVKAKAYQKIAKEMDMSPEAVRKKLSILRITYTAERWKLLARKSGEKKYIPTLAWYGEMNFLDEYITKKPLDKANKKTNAEENICQSESEQNFNGKEIICLNNCGDGGKSDYVPSCNSPLNFVNTHSKEPSEYKCRICSAEDVELDWNDVIHGHNNITYKDCYYKYTQLAYYDEDNFPNMLCRKCSNGLEYIDNFIAKAIEAHVALQEKYRFNVITEDDKKHESSNVEAILGEETVIKPEIETCIEDYIEECVSITPEENMFNLSEICSTPLIKQKENRNDIKAEIVKKTIKGRQSKDPLLNTESLVEDNQSLKNVKEKICCSICSKVLSSRYVAIRHEELHKTRERNVACEKCGLKFYDKSALRCHMVTHIENRTRKHRCEFCDKTFYEKGPLNIHRRIHLGQMVHCTLCTKKYYRQYDLEKHMASHSASTINSDIKVKKIHFVRCKDCGKNIRTTNFKAHAAKHMNAPVAKCSICNKEYFCRKSCMKHLKKTHKILGEETKNLIISYKNNRLSHLFLKQYANGEVTNQ